MEYKIISVQSLFSPRKGIEKLEKAVNEAIGLGWEPVGGVTVTDHGTLSQAMIKRR